MHIQPGDRADSLTAQVRLCHGDQAPTSPRFHHLKSLASGPDARDSGGPLRLTSPKLRMSLLAQGASLRGGGPGATGRGSMGRGGGAWSRHLHSVPNPVTHHSGDVVTLLNPSMPQSPCLQSGDALNGSPEDQMGKGPGKHSDQGEAPSSPMAKGGLG